PPVLIGRRTPGPNAYGWNNTDVTVTFEAYDALSGLASMPGPTTLTMEGANLAVLGTAVDNAGNVTSVMVGNINIDRTPPVLLITRPEGDEGLLLGAALDFSAQDALSGVAGVTGLLDDGSATREVYSGDVLPTGAYILSVEAADLAGNAAGESRFFAVCDPKGPFVAGSGSFTSPADAMPDNPRYSGTALFSFTCRYMNGETVPSSRWTFDFEVANLSFRSSSYEWLAVYGATARFRGRGSLNGSGDYGFMVTGLDGKVAGTKDDLIRVVIWDRSDGRVIYDSQPGDGVLAAPETPLLKNGRIQLKG
ncbi:MAG: hypothetical protein QME94_05815, partial [Anaerolineae bacterium]|nr:hypothetical protein [Anaerolineae bacterium]